MVTTTFNKFVSAQGRADMVMENHGWDLVKLTDVYGDVHTCYIRSTSMTPDDEPLVVIEPKPATKDGLGYMFASDIVQVETIEEG